MPVVIEVNANLAELMTKVGCDAALIAAAKETALKVGYSLEGVKVLTDTQWQTAPIKIGTLQSILSGKLPEGPVKNLAKIHLEKVVKKLLLSLPPSHHSMAFKAASRRSWKRPKK